MNYYKRHIGDYSAATSHLDLIEHGAYARLMDVYYVRERGIPAAQAERLCGARSPEEKRSVNSVLAEFFELVDPNNPEHNQLGFELGISEPTWIQRRCEKEIKMAIKKARINAKNGKTGGRPRKKQRKILVKSPVGTSEVDEKTQTVSAQNPHETQMGARNNPNPLIHESTNLLEEPPISHPPKSKPKSGKPAEAKPAAPTETELDAQFAEWWAAYPVKTGRKAARDEWARASRKITPAELLVAVRAYRFGGNMRFVPDPERWLRRERWADEVHIGDIRTSDGKAAGKLGYLIEQMGFLPETEPT